ncbi:MAG: fibrobacter succinogenes major paralogous domain-containing protein, partial [Flavobacteriales bacterium]|nr:fibrobacter succinogenes major paralogous domain-containing protein [Flavobacteriales bacterium]
MKYLLTSLLCVFTLSLTLQSQTLSADNDGDGCVATSDLMTLLSQFGECYFTCGDFVSHEGYDYSTVQIGEQCWFSENCRYLPEVSPSSEGSETDPYYYVYGYEGTDVASAMSTSNYETYGALYNWSAVMANGGSLLCPSGWHIPSDGEFTELTDFLGGVGVAGGKMKEAGYEHWNSPNTGGTNSSGF